MVLDLGNVVIDWNPRHLYRRHFPGDDAGMEAFLATVCPPSFNDELDAGRPFAEAIAARVARFPDHAALIELWQRDWEQMLGDPIEASVQILADLRARGVPRYALSNWSEETFPIARDRFAFLDWFDGIVISGEVGCIKPDPAIFAALAERFGLTPAVTVFVDDNHVNVEGGRRAGFDAVLFTTPEDLRADLMTRGLL